MIPVFLTIAAIIIALATAKTILFIKNIGDRKIAYWFFFPRYNVIPSSRVSRKSKELQNKLSKVIFSMLLLETLVWMLLKIY